MFDNDFFDEWDPISEHTLIGNDTFWGNAYKNGLNESHSYTKYQKKGGGENDFLFFDRNTGDVYYLDPDTERFVQHRTKVPLGWGSNWLGVVTPWAHDEDLNKVWDEIQEDRAYAQRQQEADAVQEAQREQLESGDSLLNIPTPTAISQNNITEDQKAEYLRRKSEANQTLAKMLYDSNKENVETPDNTIYYKQGVDEIDLNYYLHNIGSNLQKYLESKNWSQAQKDSFLKSYERYKNALSTQLSENSGRLFTDDGGYIHDNNGELSGERDRIYIDKNGQTYNSLEEIPKKLQKSAVMFSPNDEVANYFNTIGKAIVGAGKTKKTSSESQGEFDLNNHGFLRYWNNKINPAGTETDLAPFIGLDPLDPTGKREFTNRTTYLAHQLNNYLTHIKNSKYKFDNTNFKNKDSYIAKIQEAIDNLNNGWDSSDIASLQAIGIGQDFLGTFMTDKAKPNMSEQELATEQAQLKAQAESDYIEKLKSKFDTYANQGDTFIGKDKGIIIPSDSRYTPGTEGADQRIAQGLRNLGYPVENENSAGPSAQLLWRNIVASMALGKSTIETEAGIKKISEVLPIIMPSILMVDSMFKDSASNPGLKYYDNPNVDLQNGSILCYQDGKLFYKFIGDVKECAAWKRLEDNFNKSYVVSDGKPRYSFRKLGGIIQKLNDGGNVSAEDVDPETMAMLQQIYAQGGAQEQLEQQTKPLSFEEVINNAVYGPTREKAKASGLSYKRYLEKSRTPTGTPDALHADNGQWKKEDYVRLGAILTDIASMFNQEVVSGAVMNLGSTAANFTADWMDKSVTSGEMLKNLAANLGFDALGLMPIIGDVVGTGGSIMKNLKNFAPKISKMLTAYGIAATLRNGQGVLDSLGKVVSDEKLNVQDWQNIAQAISAVLGVKQFAVNKNKAANIKANAKVSDAIGIGLRKKGSDGNLGEAQDFIFQGQKAKELQDVIATGNVSDINAKLQQMEGFKDYVVNESLATVPLGVGFPVGKGADGKWGLQSPIHSNKVVDTFDIYDSNTVRNSEGFLNTNRQDAVVRQGRAYSDEMLMTPAEIEATLKQRVKDLADATGATEVRDRMNNRRQKLEQDIADLTNTKSTYENDASNVKTKTDAANLRQQLTDLQNKYGVSKPGKQALNKLDNALSSLNIKGRSVNYIQAKNRINNIDSKIQDKTNAINRADVEITNLTNRIGKPGESKSTLEFKIKEAEKNKVKLQKEIDSLDSEKSKLQSFIQDKDAIDNLKAELRYDSTDKIFKTDAELQFEQQLKSYSDELSVLNERLKRYQNGFKNPDGSRKISKAYQDFLNQIGPSKTIEIGGVQRDVKQIIKDLHLMQKGGRFQFLKHGNIIKGQQGFKDIFEGTKWEGTRYRNLIDQAKNWYTTNRGLSYNTNNNVPSTPQYDKEVGTEDQVKQLEAFFKPYFAFLQSDAGKEEAKRWAEDYVLLNRARGSEQYGKDFFNPDGTFNHEAFKNSNLYSDFINGIGHDIYKGNTFIIDGADGEPVYYRDLLDGYEEVDTNNNPEYNDTKQVRIRRMRKKNPTQEEPGVEPSSIVLGDQPELISNGNGITRAGGTSAQNNNQNKFKAPNYRDLIQNAYPKIMDVLRYRLIDNDNRRNALDAMAAQQAFLQNPVEHQRRVYGDLQAQMEANAKAAELNNIARRTATTDANQNRAFQLEAFNKGTQYIEAGNKQDNTLRRQTEELAWQQNKENKANASNVATQNMLSLIKNAQNKQDIWNAYRSQHSSDRDNLLMKFQQEWETKNAEKESIRKQALLNRSKIAVRNNPNQYNAGLTDEESAVWNLVLQGKSTSTLSEDQKAILRRAQGKISLAQNNEYYRLLGVDPDQYSDDLLYSPSNARIFETHLSEAPETSNDANDVQLLTRRGKNGIKLEIAKIRDKAKNADRFQKVISEKVKSLDKKIDRIARHMYGLPKSEVIKAQ